MAKFYSADYHFGHQNVITLSKRPFEDLKEMTEAIVERHNERIKNSDDVYFLGDFGFEVQKGYLERIFNKLNGRKHLIIGNHDKKEVLRLPWSSKPRERLTVVDEGRTIVLSHYAERSWNKMYRGAFHLFGHCHGKLQGYGRSTDVGVDAWNFSPVTADQAIERMMEWNKDFDTYAPEEEDVITGPELSLARGL